MQLEQRFMHTRTEERRRNSVWQYLLGIDIDIDISEVHMVI